MKNVFEQFDEVYSRWSMLDKVGKEMQLARMWQQLCATYNHIIRVWQFKGYLTVDEYNYINQIYQLLIGMNNQKMIVDKQLSDEMMNHLVMMLIKK